MKHLILAAVVTLSAGPALAQAASPSLATTADQFRNDLRGIAHVAATAALIHANTNAWPDTPFALLGSSQATQTGLRAFQLSGLTLAIQGEALRVQVVPLPSPYVSDDRIAEFTVTQGANGEYMISHEITRRADPDKGGARLAYDQAEGLEVGRAFGTLCVDVNRVRAMLAAGDFAPDPTRLSATPLTVRVTPPGEAEPTFYIQTDPSRQP